MSFVFLIVIISKYQSIKLNILNISIIIIFKYSLRFYIGCDICNNWFHGECVGITEEQSKNMTDFTCQECDRARSSEEVFCLCRTPYDQSQ